MQLKSSLIEKISLQKINDDCLMCVAEAHKHIPFDIKRIYYIVRSEPNLPRGYHTHRSLQQAFFCIQGSVKMILDNGYKRETITLTDPSEGILLRPMVWHEMHDIAQDTIMLIFASDSYSESDYIREYSEFKKAADDISKKN